METAVSEYFDAFSSSSFSFLLIIRGNSDIFSAIYESRQERRHERGRGKDTKREDGQFVQETCVVSEGRGRGEGGAERGKCSDRGERGRVEKWKRVMKLSRIRAEGRRGSG